MFKAMVQSVQDRARGWTKDIVDDSSAQVDAVVHSVLSRIDDAKLPRVVYGLVGTLTGNKRAAARARKAAVHAVRRGERKIKRSYQRRKGMWLVAAVAGGVLVWRSLHAAREQEAAESREGTSETVKGESENGSAEPLGPDAPSGAVSGPDQSPRW